nr:hypothetical protein [Kofleriaceae bacterium]
MQELRYSSDGKTAEQVKTDATHLVENAPVDSDVSLTYATAKGRTYNEATAATEQGKAASFARDWFSDPTLQKAFNGLDNAGVEHGAKGPALMWEAAAERTFRNAKAMSSHLQHEFATNGNLHAVAERVARLQSVDVRAAEATLQQFAAANYDAALASTATRAQELRAQDQALQARRRQPNPEKWQPAMPTVDAQGQVTEAFAGLRMEAVAYETRTITEALRIWSAETGQQHGNVTQLGLTIHAGEQVLNSTISPFELLNQVDQAISMGADRVGHALIVGIEPSVLVSKGRLMPAEVPAFTARQREVVARLKAKGVVIEANLSSNTEISNLTRDEHPAGTFVDEKLRVTVNTDDETVLQTTLKQELLKVAQAPGVQRADVAAMVLEGYRSRMGNRELAQRGRIKPELQRTLMAGLSAAELSALSMSLAQHFHVELAATPQLTIARVIDAAVGL